MSTSNSRGEVHESDIGSAVIEHVAGRKLVTTTSTTVTSSRHSNVNIQHQSSASGSVRRVAESEDISRSKEALLDSVLGHANESGDDSNAGSESDTQ